MRLQPVCARAAVGHEGDAHGEGFFHFLDHDGAYLFQLVGVDGKVEFVVHLQYHFRAYLLFAEAAVDAHHGHFDNVSRSALNRCVHGVSFGVTAHYGIFRHDVRQIAATPEPGDDVTPFAAPKLLKSYLEKLKQIYFLRDEPSQKPY